MHWETQRAPTVANFWVAEDRRSEEGGASSNHTDNVTGSLSQLLSLPLWRGSWSVVRSARACVGGTAGSWPSSEWPAGTPLPPWRPRRTLAPRPSAGEEQEERVSVWGRQDEFFNVFLLKPLWRPPGDEDLTLTSHSCLLWYFKPPLGFDGLQSQSTSF